MTEAFEDEGEEEVDINTVTYVDMNTETGCEDVYEVYEVYDVNDV